MDDGAPVFGGAKAPRIMLGIDIRVLPVLAILILIAAFATMGGMVPFLVVAGVAAIVWGIARAFASRSPLLIDEIVHAFALRWNTPPAIPDDAHATAQDVAVRWR